LTAPIERAGVHLRFGWAQDRIRDTTPPEASRS
jgi:hypothetical protein